ncbi:MAG: hypothetical protein APG12_00431 [Candidatus Methanofastidiosum methylothiophilum]|uniref:Uncharacterized protein n=1 Tax=Candidatus Methanofastidiosum methylothiophilum TaxID=1705564 RepID=A0A150J1C2_9EURY|nr:MAG: hypothetical protein APG10_01753 [Candidatus Methanofastidiosum methylthiophilus]KYC46531.1 MAG: hypothetical protein APG11_01837 [Candidatus Methanofastidiosum methylthiophilus]KYC51007.1 MAG: hypothetical protein APG12_00431 [Candidatus Methanofastidiosum methylthiophilus]
MKDVEIKCPHCDKKIIIPESLLLKIIEKYQQDNLVEKQHEFSAPVDQTQDNNVTPELENELTVKKEQLAEVMSKLERNQADFTRVVKRNVKPEDMYRIQKERTILMQKAKNLQEEIAAITNQLGKQNNKSSKVNYL